MNYKILFLSLCSLCFVVPILTPFLAPFLTFTGLEAVLEWKVVRDSRELPTIPSQEEAQPTKEERMRWLLGEEPPIPYQEEAQPFHQGAWANITLKSSSSPLSIPISNEREKKLLAKKLIEKWKSRRRRAK
ncbi:hypothetical protein IPdc08_00440 [archaeon]|nr:hypothetical protein IPdc08_00440 [archaeon]